MSATDRLYLESLALLQHLAAEEMPPEAAQEPLRTLRARHPEARLELLWEREPYGHTVHYDLLVSHDGRNAAWLGWCPDRGIPWVFRGVQRHSEADLVRVNGETVRVDGALQLIDYMWNDQRIIDALVDSRLMSQAMLALDIPAPSDAELQQAVDAFRLRHGLCGRAETLAWLDRRGMTYEQLECYIADAARVQALRHRVVGAAIEAHFARHRDAFRRVTMLLLRTRDAAVAEAVARDGRGGPGAFVHAAAQQAQGERTGMELVVQAVRELPAPMAEEVGRARPDTLLGPVCHRGMHYVDQVLALHEAVLDEGCAEAISTELFRAWLESQRLAAEIEWLWGRELPARA